MKRIISMALKDLRLLSRDKAGAFFIILFPVLMGLFFGLMMGGVQGGGGTSTMKIAIVDQDDSEISRAFAAILSQNDSLDVQTADLESARQSVRKGARVAMVVLTAGFGNTAGVFWEQPPVIQIGADPSRMAEAGMLQGYVMEGIGQLVQKRFENPTDLRGSILRQRDLIADDETIDPTTRLLLGGLFGSVESMLDNMDALQEEADADDGKAAGHGGPQFQFCRYSESGYFQGNRSYQRFRAIAENPFPVGYQFSASDDVGRVGLRSRICDFNRPGANQRHHGSIAGRTGFAIRNPCRQGAGLLSGRHFCDCAHDGPGVRVGHETRQFLESGGRGVLYFDLFRRHHDDNVRVGQNRAVRGWCRLGDQHGDGDVGRSHDAGHVHAIDRPET
jgi:hypothetical protein